MFAPFYAYMMQDKLDSYFHYIFDKRTKHTNEIDSSNVFKTDVLF